MSINGTFFPSREELLSYNDSRVMSSRRASHQRILVSRSDAIAKRVVSAAKNGHSSIRFSGIFETLDPKVAFRTFQTWFPKTGGFDVKIKDTSLVISWDKSSSCDLCLFDELPLNAKPE